MFVVPWRYRGRLRSLDEVKLESRPRRPRLLLVPHSKAYHQRLTARLESQDVCVQESRLLKLPAEVRALILSHVFEGSTFHVDRVWMNEKWPKTTVIGSGPPERKNPHGELFLAFQPCIEYSRVSDMNPCRPRPCFTIHVMASKCVLTSAERSYNQVQTLAITNENRLLLPTSHLHSWGRTVTSPSGSDGTHR